MFSASILVNKAVYNMGFKRQISCVTGDTEIIEKVQKRATKLIMSLKHFLYTERLKQLMLPTLKYRCLCGDMIEVFKIVHDFWKLQ